jgi:DNA primase small subunit
MQELKFLKKLFNAYYRESYNDIPIVNSFEFREFGFIPWEKQIMIRHLGFEDPNRLKRDLIEKSPRHAYSSGSIYLKPDNQSMENKEYRGCDLLIDIDVDHFYTPCKDDHDLWFCESCGINGKGMLSKCPKCGKPKLKTLTWICEECLNIAKKEINKLIYDFLIPDFAINEKEIKIAFSGHRGYHLKIESEKIRSLTSEDRREIVDYVTGKNISFEILGLKEVSNIIYGLSKENIGWAQKVMIKIEEFLNRTNSEIEKDMLDKRKFGFNKELVKSFLMYKNDFIEASFKNQRNIWAIEGFGLITWKRFLEVIVKMIAIEIDEPVSIDVHRLIRYPGSLHGKTGFKVQELEVKQLDDFNPLDENEKKIDPVVFKSKTTQKIQITEQFVPITKIGGESYGPYTKEEIIEIPHHVAVLLLCKEVAKII